MSNHTATTGSDQTVTKSVSSGISYITSRNEGSDASSLHFGTRGSAGVREEFRIDKNGNLTANDTSIGSLSDQRLKENIQDYTYDLATFKQYRPRTFDWKNPVEHSGRTDNRGFIAQELELVDDYWIYEYKINKEAADFGVIEGNKAKASKLDKVDAMYISVIQQLITKIETLEAKVAVLEG